MNIQNIDNLKIHKLSKAQYERELAAGRIDPNALYLTPDEPINNATTTESGLMSAEDKEKLDSIETGANNYTYTLPAATSSVLGGIKIGSNITNSSGTISLTKSNVISALGYTPPQQDTTYTFNGAVSTIKDSNLTASRALISNSSGKVAVSDITSTELGYLDGVTNNIQTQLNNKFKRLGDNPLTAFYATMPGDVEVIDNPAAWVSIGTGQCYIGNSDKEIIDNYPGGYNSHMLNFIALGAENSVAHQVIFTTVGKIYHRYGSGDAWTISWTEVYDDASQVILDIKTQLDSAVPIIDVRGEGHDMDAIFQSGAQFKIYRTDNNTLNTPYKAGVTGTYTSSYIITITSSATYGQQFAFINGGKYQFTRNMSNGTIGDWRKIVTEDMLGTQVTYSLSGSTLTITPK